MITSNHPPSTPLARFVEFLHRQHPHETAPRTLLELRLAIRQERLTEISCWTFQELDEVEQEAARHSDMLT